MLSIPKNIGIYFRTIISKFDSCTLLCGQPELLNLLSSVLQRTVRISEIRVSNGSLRGSEQGQQCSAQGQGTNARPLLPTRHLLRGPDARDCRAGLRLNMT